MIFIPHGFPPGRRVELIYGHQLLRIFERLYGLGLTDSQSSFSTRWCGMGRDLLRDHARRGGATAKVSARTVKHLRERLVEAAGLMPANLAVQVQEIDREIARDICVADLLGRRSAAI
jgi:hypothetical protein